MAEFPRIRDVVANFQLDAGGEEVVKLLEGFQDLTGLVLSEDRQTEDGNMKITGRFLLPPTMAARQKIQDEAELLALVVETNIYSAVGGVAFVSFTFPVLVV